jgi:hypothetical protein
MKIKIIKANKWARTMTNREIKNWIESMMEIKRVEKAANYWDGYRLIVRCPYNQPLAICQ